MKRRLGHVSKVRTDWDEVVQDLQKFMTGWCHYFRHGQSSATFERLDHYLLERISRNLTRSQPRGKKTERRDRTWWQYVDDLRKRPDLPQHTAIAEGSFKGYKGQANVRWRAV